VLITSTYPRATAVLNRYRRYVVQQSKSNLTKAGHKASGKLYGSVRGYVNKKFNRSALGAFTGGSTVPSLTFEYANYGEFIDEGVHGSESSYMENSKSPYKFGRGDAKSVPVGPIRKWCQSKGIDTKLAYVIARSVHKKGIKRSMFFSKPFEKRYPTMVAEYHTAVATDIQINIARQMERALKKSK